jgi:hypothetical protein
MRRIQRRWTRVLPWILRAAVVAATGAFLYAVIWLLPRFQVSEIRDPARALELETAARGTIATIVGGGAVLIGLFFTFRQLRAFEQTVAISRIGQVSERFARAIDQLASNQLESRIGAIYSFEHIASESEPHYGPILEILTTFLRDRATPKYIDEYPPIAGTMPRYPTDLQAIITVLGRRTIRWPEHKLDFREATLRYASSRYGNFEDCNFEKALLEHADFTGARLAHANLCFTRLDEAKLDRADLTGAQIAMASCVRVTAYGAIFHHADANHTLFKDANLHDIDFTEANLSETRFSDSRFGESLFSSARLNEAKLFGADLSSVKHLTQKQLEFAWTDNGTKVPKRIKIEGREKYHLPNTSEERVEAIARRLRGPNLEPRD